MAQPRSRLITARDRELLAWIGTHGIVTTDQVARRFFDGDSTTGGKRAAHRRLAILQELGLVVRTKTPFWRAPWVIRVTKAGAGVGEIDLQPARIVEGELRHAVALVDLMERLATSTRGVEEVQTEREIRTERYRERRDGGRRPGRGRTPDGVVILRDGTKVAIELDLTPKRSKDFERILRDYRQERYDKIWWYVVPGAVPRVKKLVKDNRSDDFIDVRSWAPE